MQAEPMLSFGVPVRNGARFFRWIGSDDWLEPSSALRCVEALEANPDAVGVTTPWRHVDEEGTRVLALELAIDGPFCRVHDCLATRRIAREPAKVRLARYHSTIKEVKHASEVRLAPCWTMYRDLAKVVINSSLSPLDRALGTALVVTFGALHHVRALGERAIKLVGQRQGAATTA